MTTYDTLSRWYDWLAASERQHTDAGLSMLAVQLGERVLEIGCGTGRAAAQMAAMGGQVTAIDLSWGMLQVAGKRAAEAGLTVGDGYRLPFRSEQFDAVFMSFTLELFASPAAVLAECRRVLRVAGRLGVVSLQRRDKWPVRVYDWVHHRWPVWIDCRPIQVCAVVEQAGFRVMDSAETTMWGLPVTQLVAT
ncbi:MAG: methyltransferase domain-containing protein [Anaerolineae bacterium]|nr:methyltransferase domain-containing protein [Anaerolineae bacterium]MCO5197954.1 methyltransferase domain-containing protein [Anaerolineae bacterium]MCO5203402.1 methyltransferase domain-containing protein [Anaerolineae bacterium]